MSKYTFIAVLIIVATVSGDFAQAKVPDQDEVEAVKVARSFSRRIQQTKDLNPLIPEFFSRDFSRNLPGSQSFVELEWLTPEVAAKMDRRLLRRFFVGMFNFGYLSATWGFSKYAFNSGGNRPTKSIFPPDVWKAMLRDPYLAAIAKDEVNSQAKRIDNTQQLLHLTETLEFIATRFRQHLQSFPKAQTKQYKKSLSDLNVSIGPFFEPYTVTCGDIGDCLDALRPGEKYIQITIPPAYILFMAGKDGRMRIIDATVYTN